MIFGLGAALGWGLADLGAAVVGRRIGSLATLVVAQLAGASAFGVLLLVARPGFHASTGDVIVLLGNGMVAALAYLALYRALELGPVALVSPIVAAYAAITVPLAVLVLHESLSGLVLAGAVVTIVGVVLTSTDLRPLGRGAGGGRDGVLLALVSMALFGVTTFEIGRFAQEIGWLVTISISRLMTTAVLLGLALVRRPALRTSEAGLAGAAVIVGLVDVFGICSYALGSELGLVSIVAAASATFPLIPVLGAVVFFGERPAVHQALGVVLVVAGLLLLGAGR